MLRRTESWDFYTNASAITTRGWTNVGATISGGRTGSCMQYQNTNQGAQMTIDSQATWIVGFAFQTNSWNASSGSFYRLYDSSTGQVHIALNLNTSGGNKIEVRRGAGGTVLATTATSFTTNAWYYIELKVTISDTVGSIDMQVNGITDAIAFASGSNGSQDTRNGSSTTADSHQFVGPSAGNAFFVDDHYFCDGQDGTTPQGRANNDFLGDCKVQVIRPSGDGNSSQWVGSDGNSTNNSLLVDETLGDTSDYVESSTVNDKDTYAFGDVTPSSGTVFGVTILPYAAKTDAGTRQIATVTRLSSTEVVGATSTLTASAIYYPELQCLKPGGGTWAMSDVNSAEFGVKVIA